MKRLKMTGVLIMTVLMSAAFATWVSAGDLEPPGAPASTMHSLEDIYTLVENINNNVDPAYCYEASVAKTGQKTSYGTGDDGGLEKGGPWPEPRFTDNEDGTVTDNLTGLIWLKQANYNSTTGTTGSANWAEALAFCNALESGQCGLSDGSSAGDWRLPNKNEFESLTDISQYNPALPAGNPFIAVLSSIYFWTSSTYASNTESAWVMYMNYGYTYYREKTNNYYVWPVRDGN